MTFPFPRCFSSVINCYAFIFSSVTPDLCSVAAFYEKQFVFVIRQWTICLFKSSNVLEHFMWPQKTAVQPNANRALIWNSICDCIYNNLNFSMHVSVVGERHEKNLKAFSSFSHFLSRLTGASIWLREEWLMEIRIKAFKYQNSCNLKSTKQQKNNVMRRVVTILNPVIEQKRPLACQTRPMSAIYGYK